MAQPTLAHRPRISRETRRLLIAAVLAVFALWILARVRFTGDERPAPAVQPLLGQIAARPTFADLATEIARVQSRVRPALLALPTTNAASAAVPPSDVTAVRLDDTLAIAWLPDYPRRQPRDVDLATVDSSSGLALLSVKTAGDALTLTPWTPLRPQDPRYLLATTAHSGGVSLRPVFVPALAPVIRAAWPGQLWRTASDSGLSPGSFVFTLGGDFAGLVIDDGGERAIVGGDALQAEIDRLRSVPPRTPGYLGVEVQALSPAVAAVTGATGGVVVTWVDPDGAAAGAIGVGDVIEEANGERLALEQWAVRIARLSAGATVTVRVRRGGEMREVALVARAREPSVAAQLGLILRTVPGVGSEVIRVMPSAAAQRAGIEPGDVITMAGDTKTPTAAQVRGTYASGGTDRGVLLALTRGAVHRVVVLER